MFDVTTPTEVWQEYSERKVKLYEDFRLSDSEFDAAVRAMAEVLGVGLHPSDLSDAQREEWDAAIEKWSRR